MADLGDQLAEALECLESDPVFISRHDSQWDSVLLRTEWDTVIGELQDEGIVGPFGNDGDIEYYEPNN